MVRRWIALLIAVPSVALPLAGCGNPCEGAKDRILRRYEECGVTVAQPQEGEEPAETVCSDADATYLDCVADCADSASCEAIKGEDSESAVDFGKCNGDCKSG